ncbi:MAG: cytochrome ubiquinol oxidase subunit I [Bacteroidota bacterium]|nr:cytochrome ubiquinol oxidase subunit I [Bacteroidota bacterium]
MDILTILAFNLVDWSRAQFALTAIFHWLFVPLTLGLSFLIAIMESVYVKTGNPEWKRITKFWMTLFGINFAIGIATGLILEFEFGTNWSNYSWFVGDIFGAPLATEGIMAFFLEATFVAVMFFGWNKVGKGFHLTSTWLTAVGANLSALWILVANAWMQYPVGMQFNPDTARNEMMNFWEVLLSPVAINKFFHTVLSGYVTGAVFMTGVSAWFLLKKRETLLAQRSILTGSAFGLVSAILLAVSGDGSAYNVAQKQPMKLAAMEGLYQGKKGTGLVVFGFPAPDKKIHDGKDGLTARVEIPKILSLLGYRDKNAFVPGIEDIVDGGYKPEYYPVPFAEKEKAFSASEKIRRGKIAVSALKDFRNARKNGDRTKVIAADSILKTNFNWFGYGYLKSPEDIIPNVPVTFYSFHIMVGLGFFFILLFALLLFHYFKKNLGKKNHLLRLALWTIPLVYLASEAGWVVAEVGRQPWAIQNLLPDVAAVSMVDSTSVMITFILFAVIFAILLTAELMIMIRQIKAGPKEGGTTNV